MARYSSDSEAAEREPLENPRPSHPRQSPDRQHRPYHDQQQPTTQHYDQNQPPQYEGRSRNPDPSFDRLHAERRLSRGPSQDGGQAPYLATSAGASAALSRSDQVSPISPPQPPPHRDSQGRYWTHELGYPQSNITPGADNFGDAAAGGMVGIAHSVAEHNARESGLEAMRAPYYPQQAYQGHGQHYRQEEDSDEHEQHGYRDTSPQHRGRSVQALHPAAYAGGYTGERYSHSSFDALNAAAYSPAGAGSVDARTPSSRSLHSFNNELYHDDPYPGYSIMPDPNLGVVNPNEIEDDGDEGLDYGRRGARTSILSLGGTSKRSRHNRPTAAAGAAAAAGGAAGGIMGALGGLVGKSSNPRNGTGQYYDPVHAGDTGPMGGGGGGTYDLGGSGAEKPSEWLSKRTRSSKKWKWLILIGVGLIIAAGIACGVVFGVVKKGGKGGSSSEQTASGDTDANGDLTINSPDIRKLLNNPNLHKVFPGVDYTPVNTQYPACLTNPPSQNNVTRDVAVLSQLTNTIRLYGTDCNQTEMAIHALKQLKMEKDIKIWMGVWQDKNQTTNGRQLAQMWDILDTYGDAPFKGVIVANEILFREQMSASELGKLLSDVRSNITSKGMSLPVATSDLGDALTAELVEQSDYVMANIHPFFGGINAKDAASWTYSFWENHNGAMFKTDKSKNIISETGWPTQGGTDCGTTATTHCPDAAVAGIDELNQFMEDWVCPALTNGTEYFWFEAFDEPWKIQYDGGDQNWEDHWGLMDVNRNLKKGVKIPDCDGKTV